MAVLRLVRYPLGREAYDAVASSMRLHTEHPLGLIMHGASEIDGEMQLAQIWDAAEYAERFERDVLEPALVANGITERGETTIIELHDLVTP
jgi:hypothetical protein